MKTAKAKPAIAHTPVKSSQIASVGYDATTKTMEIKFKTGGHYSYPGVTPDVHAKFMAAESIGKHFSQHIRGKYESKRLDTKAGKERDQ